MATAPPPVDVGLSLVGPPPLIVVGGTFKPCGYLEADLQLTPDHGTAPVSVTFTDRSVYSSQCAPTEWHWDFGDGNLSSLQNPTHSYTVAGTYVVTLTVVGPCMSASATAVIVVASGSHSESWSFDDLGVGVSNVDYAPPHSYVDLAITPQNVAVGAIRVRAAGTGQDHTGSGGSYIFANYNGGQGSYDSPVRVRPTFGFKTLNVWFNMSTGMPWQVQFFDASDVLLDTFFYNDIGVWDHVVHTIPGVTLAAYFEISPLATGVLGFRMDDLTLSS